MAKPKIEINVEMIVKTFMVSLHSRPAQERRYHAGSGRAEAGHVPGTHCAGRTATARSVRAECVEQNAETRPDPLTPSDRTRTLPR
jgi:hypothetical protein